MMWPVRAVPFISSGVTYSPPVCLSSSTSHPLSGSIHTALHHSDGPANHWDQWLGLDLPKWSYPGLHRRCRRSPHPHSNCRPNSPTLTARPSRVPLSIRLASMHIHQLSRASWPAKRARPCTHTHTHKRATSDGEADRPGKQTSHSPVVHIMFHDFAARDVSCPKKHIGAENTEHQKKKKKVRKRQ